MYDSSSLRAEERIAYKLQKRGLKDKETISRRSLFSIACLSP
jgi:hypothetical protein